MKKFLKDLAMHGVAYLVGGAVRDAIMGLKPHDYDYCVAYDVTQYFHCIPTGARFGIYTIPAYGDFFEVARMRKDGDYKDFRHCDVIYTDDITEDLSRRDLTINAMAMPPDGKIIDPFGGQEDLSRKVIRTVGDPMERFSEDPLRIMRVFRFAAKMGFSIDPETKKAADTCAYLLARVSHERIRDEITKIIMADATIFSKMEAQCAVIMPVVNDMMATAQSSIHHCYNVGMHSCVATNAYNGDDPVVAWAIFMHDSGKPACFAKAGNFNGHAAVSAEIAREVMRNFHFSNADIARATAMIACHEVQSAPSDRSIRRMMASYGYQAVKNVADIIRPCDIDGQSEFEREKKESDCRVFSDRVDAIHEESGSISMKKMPVNGNDIAKCGYIGKEIGVIKDRMFEAFIANPDISRDEMMAMIERIKKD